MIRTIRNTCMGLMLLQTLCFAQEFDLEDRTREVIVSLDHGGTAKASVGIENEKIEPENDLYYYWYASGHINKNRGGYTGNLLTGGYTEFNAAHKLICKGRFEEGLKDGDWKYWDEDGNLIRKVGWRKGQKHGKEIVYVIADSTVVEKYRRGKKVTGFNFLWFGADKKEDDKKEKTGKERERAGESDKTGRDDEQKDRKWFRFLRRDKDEKQDEDNEMKNTDEEGGTKRRNTADPQE